MTDEFYIGHNALEKLSGAFSREADLLGEQLAKFKPKTDSEAIHDGFGFLTESEEVTSAYIELAEAMTKAIEGLQEHAYAVGDNLDKNSHNSAAADKAIEEQFKGGGQ
ncbi:hypothetical protein QIS99_19160 [Streptomyces sp. B-S-A8]|uniref:Uncharacterized protein n=1 Tax=Streptomyces solicavernae TaxID=3043614 RepID=A0ABT6RV35_9ACTN|nr:hypothetical protein [Streptomyces sp. B-S-A8]MDI3388306.1 hypothetical protein [Streptomyces sp. B-S-A8]